MDSISIPLSKGKLALFTIGSFTLVAGCVGMLLARHSPGIGLFYSIVAVLGILWFGFFGLFGIRKLFDGQPGLLIDSEGIVDNSNAIPAGRIPWTEIKGFCILEGTARKSVTIMVASPEKYIEVKGLFRRWQRSENLKMTGSPINISANALQTNVQDLLHLLTEAGTRFQKADAQVQ